MKKCILWTGFLILALVFWVFRADAGEHRPKIVIIPTCEASSPYDLMEARKKVEAFMDVDLYSMGLGVLPSAEGLNLEQYDAVFIVGNAPETIKLKEAVDKVKAKTKVIVVAPLVLEGNVDLSRHPNLEHYWFNRCAENFRRLMVYVGVHFCRLDRPVEEPLLFPNVAIYHPDAGGLFSDTREYLAWYGADSGKGRRSYDPEALTIGFVFHKANYTKTRLEVIDALIRSAEKKGCNVLAMYSPDGKAYRDIFSEGNKPLVDVVVSLKDQLDSADHEQGIAAAQKVNVPILHAPVHYYRTVDAWERGTDGLGPEMVSSLTYSEVNGMFEPIMVAAKAEDAQGRDHKSPIAYQVDWRIERAIAWARLRRMNNRDKRIAVTYYSEGGGKGNVGADVDYYLDAQASLAAIFREMAGRGYNLGPRPLPDKTGLSEMMAKRGSNIGVWNKEEIGKRVREGSVILIPLDIYLAWFHELEASKQAEVIAKWGPPPGNIMVYEDGAKKSIVIPRIKLGNLILLPHPTWGLLQDKKVLHSSGEVPPHHQYIAFWFWLNREFRANAVLSIFTQISLMPGKQSGLSGKDWGALLLQNLPHIHPFPIQAGGGVHNKRRANALVIDYMPTIVPSGLSDELLVLKSKIALYDQCTEPALKNSYAKSILDKCRELKLNRELEQTQAGGDTASVVRRIEKYLNEIAGEHMPYGPHVLSEPPQGEALTEMVLSMLGVDFKRNVAGLKGTDEEARNLVKDVIADKLSPEEAQRSILGKADPSVTSGLATALDYAARINGCKDEIPRILDAMEGHYIPPGPMDDPIRNPDALPTGRNPQGFDVRAIPTEEAWETGKKLADDLLRQHVGNKGAYPRKMAFVLWSSETTKNHGVLEAQILYLLGVKPVWLKGRVKDIALIDRAELKRPRVDVVITASGLYRDHFQQKIALLDRAVRLAAQQKEKDNFVREQTLRIAKQLAEHGYNRTQAEVLSTARIFSEAIGAYSPNIQFAVPAGDTWKSERDISDLYMGRVSHIYGEHTQGQSAKEVFKYNLQHVDAAVFSRSSNVYGVLEHPMVAAYFGGLKMAVRNTTGKRIEMYITNLRDSTNAGVETLERFYNRELRSRYLNPKWIKGMMEHGYDGARYMDSFSENMWIWDVTSPDMVTEDNWQEVYEVYVKDKHNLNLKEYFTRNNPYAHQGMISTMLGAKEKGYWHPSEEVLKNLVKAYSESVAAHGISGAYGSTGGAKGKEAPGGKAPPGKPGREGRQAGPGGTPAAGTAPTMAVEGYEMEETGMSRTQGGPSGSIPYLFIVGFLFIAALLYIGYRKKR